MTKADLMISYGTVETAMREAIKIAFAAECHSFASKNRARDQYAFNNMSDFQSYVVAKSKGGRVRGDLIHVMHYYSLIDVPAFQALARTHAEKNADKPVQLKFLAGTPLSERRGINARMPVEIKPKATQPDEPIWTKHQTMMFRSLRLKSLLDPSRRHLWAQSLKTQPRPKWIPPPWRNQKIEEVGEVEKAERVVADPPDARRPTPVVLKPAKPDTAPPMFMQPTPKATPEATRHEKKDNIKEEPSERRSTKEEASASRSTTKVIHQAKEIPKRTNVEVKKEERPESKDASSSGVSTYAGNMADSTSAGPNSAPANPVDNMWKDYKGTTDTSHETPADQHQTVNIQGHAVNPPPPSPRNKGKQESGKGGKATEQHQNQQEGQGKWRPVLHNPEIPDQHAHDDSHAQHRFASSGSYASGGRGRGKGRTKEGKSQESWRSKGSGKFKAGGKRQDRNQGKSSQSIGNRYQDTEVEYWPTGCLWHRSRCLAISGVMMMITNGTSAGGVDDLLHGSRHLREGV